MRFFEDSGIGWVSEILLRVTRRSACSGVASLRYKAWYVAIIAPSRHMETLMRAIVSNVRRRLRQQFFRTRGRNRNMQVFLVYEFPRPRVSGVHPGGRRGEDGSPGHTNGIDRPDLSHVRRFVRNPPETPGPGSHGNGAWAARRAKLHTPPRDWAARGTHAFGV